ncbi:hypothetical protein EDD18DRAFT_615744 [Armillaria luteobubalina]|uniref:Histone H1 n=1 Tax=Armillaria luteobubalina TaxID=153913 RepID=A0AA39QJX2_9AGAR|nr:hypothetical protein EDD18DRAFT_615744 [Armillaria luteobubalina]
MPAAVKKTSAKAPAKSVAAATKSSAATHPSWVDMIKECITAHPEDARGGVSRPTIKKFVESKYHIDLNNTAASQLNRAITSGHEKGVFILPKGKPLSHDPICVRRMSFVIGPSGKVKLAPKVRADAAKENTKPAAKKPTATAVKAKAPCQIYRHQETSVQDTNKEQGRYYLQDTGQDCGV